MQIQLQHIFGRKGGRGQGRDEEFVRAVSARCSPTESGTEVAGLAATIKRPDGPAGESGTFGQSKRARAV